MLINGSTIHILKNSNKEDKLKDPVAIAGTIVYTIGFIFEFFADLQMIDY